MSAAPYSRERVKRGLAYFFFGKGTAALLGLLNFTLIVRLLAVPEYAAYVSIIAAMELALAFSTFGLDWAGLRYLPEVRELGGGAALRRIAVRLCLYRAASLAAAALAGLLALPLLADASHGQALIPVAHFYLGVLITEGMLRFVAGVIFDSLLMQAYGQAALLTRNACFAAALWFAAPGTGLAGIARFELASSCAGAALAVTLLFLFLRTRDAAGPAGGAAPALPSGARMRKMALHNYLSMLLNQPYSPQALLLMASLFLSPAQTAVLGFARNLTELIRRYQPVEMLLGLLRPILISTYARARDFAELARLSRLIYKLSLLTLCPVLIACTAYGDVLIAQLAQEKYASAYALVAGLAWTLLLRSHRLLAGTMANILDQPQLLTRTALATLVVLPVCAAGFSLGHGALTLFAAACVEEVIGTWIIVRGIRGLGHDYAPPWSAMARMAAICAGASGLLFLARSWHPSVPWLALQLALALVCAIGLALASGYLDRSERSMLLGAAGPGAR